MSHPPFPITIVYGCPAGTSTLVAEVTNLTTVMALKLQLKKKYPLSIDLILFKQDENNKNKKTKLIDNDTMWYHNITRSSKLYAVENREFPIRIMMMYPHEDAYVYEISIREDCTIEEVLQYLKSKCTMEREQYLLTKYDWSLRSNTGKILSLNSTVEKHHLYRDRLLYCVFVPKNGEQY